MEKATPGSPFRVPPAGIWNGMVAAGLAFTGQQELGESAANWLRPIDTNTVILRNDSGGALVRGRVLEVGAKLVTPTPEALWFEGDVPAPDGGDTIAITKWPVLTSGLVQAQVSGVVLCRLNVNHVQQVYADVDSSSTLLQSKWHGRARILWKSTASTGEQDALVMLGEMFRGPIKGIASSGLTRGSNASVAVQWAGAAASPSATVTVYWNWMDGGTVDVPTNGELLFSWFPDEQKYCLVEGECAH